MKRLTVYTPSQTLTYDDPAFKIEDITCNGVPTVRVSHGTDVVVETFRGFPFHIVEVES